MSEKNTNQFGKPIAETGAPLETIEREQVRAEVRFDSSRGTLLLGLGGKEQLDPQFLETAENTGFTPKDELHLTVIGFKQGKQLKKLIKKYPEIADKIAGLASEIEWDIQPTGERYRLTRRYEGEDVPRESIIEMVDCPGGEKFINQLNILTGLELEELPPHVTLATQGNPQGIGINTIQDIIDLGQRID